MGQLNSRARRVKKVGRLVDEQFCGIKWFRAGSLSSDGAGRTNAADLARSSPVATLSLFRSFNGFAFFPVA